MRGPYNLTHLSPSFDTWAQKAQGYQQQFELTSSQAVTLRSGIGSLGPLSSLLHTVLHRAEFACLPLRAL